MPWRMAFSARGWRIIAGTAARRRSTGTSIFDGEPGADPDSLNVEIALEDVELAAERHDVGPRVVERVAEQLAQSGDHLDGFRRS